MKLFEKPFAYKHSFSALVAVLVLQGCMSTPQKPTESAEASTSQAAEEPASEPITDLMGEWCYVRKRRVTKYTVKEGKLHIRSGRSGQYYEADLTCNEDYTVCEAKTVRGWQTPVTETLRLDGNTMSLTRVWGGAWKDKTYNFTYTRCPKW
ncbi:MAG: hypothetical protein ABW078_09220 [Sedimenticola sp.]